MTGTGSRARGGLSLILAAAHLTLIVAVIAIALCAVPLRGEQHAVGRESVISACDGTPLLALAHACTHGADLPLLSRASARSVVEAPAVRLRCSDGTSSGNRIQVLYAYFGGESNRVRALRAQIDALMLRANGVFALSARLDHGYRSLRVLQSACGAAAVSAVHLSSAARSDFDRTIFELSRDGYARPDRKYVVFADSTAMCGIASVYDDDRPTADNINDAGPSYARVDDRRGCWNGVVVAHEITHMLGGVQTSAPHSTSLNHCTDGHDLMCYADGSPQSRHLTLRRCPSSHEDVLDCGRDDYFAIHPPRGSYLASHWNVASSSFLYGSSVQPHVPGAPVRLAATTADLHVTLTWQPAPGAVDHYVIRRNDTVVATVDSTASTWKDDQPPVAVSDVYSVTAVNGAGTGRPAKLTICVPPIPPSPQNVAADTQWDSVTLTWDAAADVDHWIVQRDGTEIATLSADQTRYVDQQSAADRHAYSIVAANVSGRSAPSQPVDSGVIPPLSD